MQIAESSLEGLYVIRPTVREDSRGAFTEVMRLDLLEEATGIRPTFVQMNHSTSRANVLRGLHFQFDPPLGKFIRVILGAAFMAAVDIRKHSPTLGKFLAWEVNAENRTCLWVPPGFATGFCVLGDCADVEYLYTAHYNAAGEANVLWNDPAIGLPWPLEDPIVSERDQKAPTLQDWLARPESVVFV